MQLGNGTNNDNSNPSVSGIGGQLQNILNGGDSVALVEMKQSPISHMNGNTPINNPNSIQQQGIGGPASVCLNMFKIFIFKNLLRFMVFTLILLLFNLNLVHL